MPRHKGGGKVCRSIYYIDIKDPILVLVKLQVKFDGQSWYPPHSLSLVNGT